MVAQFGVVMQTGTGWNPIRGFRRVLGGESFFVNRFEGGPGGGWVMLAPPAPGDVREYPMQPGDELFIQSGSYLASWGGVGIDSRFQGLRGLFTGEGLFFLRATAVNAPGSVFFDSYGADSRDLLWSPAGSWWWTPATWWPSPAAWTIPLAGWAASAHWWVGARGW